MTREEARQIIAIWLVSSKGAKGQRGYIEGWFDEEDVEAFRMAIEALVQEPIIHCEDCKHHGTSNCPMWGDDTTEDYMWCCDGEKEEVMNNEIN